MVQNEQWAQMKMMGTLSISARMSSPHALSHAYYITDDFLDSFFPMLNYLRLDLVFDNVKPKNWYFVLE